LNVIRRRSVSLGLHDFERGEAIKHLRTGMLQWLLRGWRFQNDGIDNLLRKRMIDLAKTADDSGSQLLVVREWIHHSPLGEVFMVVCGLCNVIRGGSISSEEIAQCLPSSNSLPELKLNHVRQKDSSFLDGMRQSEELSYSQRLSPCALVRPILF
jgi:hypothetical protein